MRQRCESGGGQGRIGLRDFHKQRQILPARREPDHDAAGGDDHFDGDFDDAGAPGVNVTFAEWILSTAGVEVPTAAQARQCLDRQRFRGGDELRWGIGRNFRLGRGRIGDPRTLPNPQVVRQRVHQQVEVVRHEAMVAQAVPVQFGFDFLVTIFRFATVGVFVVGATGQDGSAGTIGEHDAAIRPFRFHLDLHDRAARSRWSGTHDALCEFDYAVICVVGL